MEEDGYQKIMTKEEAQEEFLEVIRGCIDYWEHEDRKPDIKDKLEGLAFSILVIFDGESMHPPCILKPQVSSPDGREWLDIGHNISGNLHDLFCKKENGLADKHNNPPQTPSEGDKS